MAFLCNTKVVLILLFCVMSAASHSNTANLIGTEHVLFIKPKESSVNRNDFRGAIKSYSVHSGRDRRLVKRDTEVSVPPDIYLFRIESNIKYRYSQTNITSKVANRDGNSQEVNFNVVLPETAFVSKFTMEIDGITYEAYVKEKEQAKKEYDDARERGDSAGLIAKSTRNSNMFHVNVNIKSQSKVTFNLIYEELLTRRLEQYEQSININPERVSSVKDYQVIVNIEESRNLSFVRVPRLSNSVDEDSTANDANVDITRPEANKATVTWSPVQSSLKKQIDQDISGSFIVQYDIDREGSDGQVLIMQGYFVHFFAPESLPPLRKYVVFVLDISGSMAGRKIAQLKESQVEILNDLSPDDYFNIIIFSTEVHLDKLEKKGHPIKATVDNVSKAKAYIKALGVNGGTNIEGALTQALYLIDSVRKSEAILNPNVQPLILFLTDGEPTEGVTNLDEIKRLVRTRNEELSVPIFSLAFGEGADFSFLKQLSLQNYGFARKIYEDSDAPLQLKGFYNEIASPLLSNVEFDYTSEKYSISDITKTKFPTVFGGGEIIIAGRLEGADMSCGLEKAERNTMNIFVEGNGRDGEIDDLKHVEFYDRKICGVSAIDMGSSIPITKSEEDKFLEKLWAYLTIQQLLEKDLALDESNKEDKRKESPKELALKLALKYGFVTPLTSLVVVKPNDTDVADPRTIDGKTGRMRNFFGKHSLAAAGVPHDAYFGCGSKTRGVLSLTLVLIMAAINY